MELCLTWGPPVPGESPAPEMELDRGGAEASGFELGLQTGGRNKEGSLYKGDPALRGSPFPWQKR